MWAWRSWHSLVQSDPRKVVNVQFESLYRTLARNVLMQYFSPLKSQTGYGCLVTALVRSSLKSVTIFKLFKTNIGPTCFVVLIVLFKTFCFDN